MTEQSTSEDRSERQRTRVRTRTRERTGTDATGDSAAGGAGGQARTAEDERPAARAPEPDSGGTGGAAGSEGSGGAEPASEAGTSGSASAEEAGEAAGETVRVRRRRRGGRGRATSRQPAAPDAGDATESPAGEAADETEAAEPKGGDASAKASGAESDAKDKGGDSKAKGAESETKSKQSKQSQRPSNRRQQQGRQGGQKGGRQSGARGGARGGASRRARGRGRGGQSPAGGVSEETRRAITEGPPRRMLVNVGDTRTQIAVLEERDLVEHYVTRREDVSYVGNVYLGRVQNVLPGMEAAFVDIGKGRNGVLYAGEVNYDEADLDGDAPRIEQTLQTGQTALVQVTKDPMGTKGARLTQNLSIAGRYCVLAPGEGMLGISRKLTDDERERLRGILKEVKPDGFGLIVRTAAEGATAEQLQADVERLVAKWEQVQERAKKAKALEPVYEEPDLVIRVIRDIFGPEYTELIVDSPELGQQVKDYLSDVSPEHVDKVSVYEGDDPIFDAYEVTTQIRRALEKKVWLKSGGYLIIEKTEAMWVIDVNTGRFVGKSNLEETVLRNNLEAADEIARQLRLRDMGGIIVIDFVDMMVPANRDEVLKRFRRELARDKTKSRVMDISKLGLVQMTRKNVSQGLTESFTEVCDCCEGRGAKIIDLG